MTSTTIHSPSTPGLAGSLLNAPFYPGQTLPPQQTRHLPKPRDFGTPKDPISAEQLARLSKSYENPPIPFLNLAPPGTNTHSDQLSALQNPRLVIDATGTIHDRFVTDSAGKSGRVYDRLHAREAPRLVRHGSSAAGVQWYDVLTGRVRRREMMDDFRDLTAHQSLDVSAEEQDSRYFAPRDIDLCDPRDVEVVNWLSDMADGFAGVQDWNEGTYEYRLEVERSDPVQLEDGELSLSNNAML